MRNYRLGHILPGYDKNLFVCSCGYQELMDQVNISTQCPECKDKSSFYLETFSNLRFGEVPFSKEILDLKDNDENLLYKFTIDIFLIKNAYKMNFGTKKIKLLDEKYDNYSKHHYRIYFNGHAYNEPMIIFKNILEPEKQYTSTEFVKEIRGLKKIHSLNYYDRIRTNNISSSSYFTNGTDNEYHKDEPYYNFINRMVKNLLNLEEYCRTHEKLIKIGIDPYRLTGEINLNGATPSDILNITPYSVKVLKEVGANKLRALQVIEQEFKEQANNYMNTFAKLDDFDIHNATRLAKLVNEARLSIPKLYKYLYKDAPMQQGLYKPNDTLTLLYDSFNLAKDLELPFDKNPKALKRYHDTLMKEHAVIADKLKNKKFADLTQLNKYLEYRPDDKIIMPTEEEVAEGKEPEIVPPEFFIKLPVDAQDLIREGKIMRHCVASYVDRVIRQETLIFFLRKTSSPDVPYCTIEVSPTTKTIRQIKGKGNRKIDNKAATNTIKEWCRKKNIEWDGHSW